MVQHFQVRTSKPTELIDITRSVQDSVRKTGIDEGICFIYVPHTTAGLIINEHADPSVSEDILMALNQMVPSKGPYHHLEGNSPAHIKSTLVGGSQMVFVESGRLSLGTWQGIFFCEFDGPRNREVWIKVIPGQEEER